VKKCPLLLIFVAAICCSPLAAQRTPVLPQIDLPHSYYYRELYLPQLTSGPSGVAWAPDSKELVYSMSGSLWRQQLDSREAVQLTDGAGYDYQPDWSPDGKSIIYVSYQKDAMELWLLDTATYKTRQLTHATTTASSTPKSIQPGRATDRKSFLFLTKGTFTAPAAFGE
jgi:dipeptidyl aminopeptidase/acylaminoacyl peptidase